VALILELRRDSCLHVPGGNQTPRLAWVRRTTERRAGLATVSELANGRLSPLFEATEEAIYNSLFAATTMSGRDGRTVEALPIDRVVALLRERGALAEDALA